MHLCAFASESGFKAYLFQRFSAIGTVGSLENIHFAGGANA